MNSPLKYFSDLSDPRVERTREHVLEEILLITIAAVLSGAGGWNEIEGYGHAKIDWFKSFLTLPGGIPSHDTFNRVFSALDPQQLEAGFAAWAGSIVRLTAGEVVAIDGKSLRGTREAGKKAIVHMVSAWANSNNLVLAQRKVDEKSNEITAISRLLEALELSGTVVTVDAMGCQRSIAQQIVEKQADYILAVKNNQGPPAGRDQGLLPHDRCRRGGRRDRLRPRAGRTACMLGDRGHESGGEGFGMVVFTGFGADRG